MPGALLAPGDADDHAVGGLLALHLQDGLARAGHVREPEALGDHAVEARHLEPVEPLLRLLAVVRRGRDVEGQLLHLLAPLLERLLVQVLAVPEEHVEDDEVGRDLGRELAASGSRPGGGASGARRSRGRPRARRRSRRRAPTSAAAARRARPARGSSAGAAVRCGSRDGARRRGSRGCRGSRPTSARTASPRPPEARRTSSASMGGKGRLLGGSGSTLASGTWPILPGARNRLRSPRV